jgi:hypothetical protein
VHESSPRLAQPGSGAGNVEDEDRLRYLEGVVDRLESDVSRLQQQVDFLEALLRERAAIH